MADGTLLQPSRPATKLDSVLVAEALGGKGGAKGGATDAPVAEVWFAETVLSRGRYASRSRFTSFLGEVDL